MREERREPYLNLLVSPLVQSDGLDLGYVCPQTSVYSTAVNADEHTESDICPVWIWEEGQREEIEGWKEGREREGEGEGERERAGRSKLY